ncbi:sensor histidine kinase [Arthrobacter sp. TMN-49]
MEKLLKVLRIWGAPAAALIFMVLWCVAEAGRMGPWLGFPTWNGTLPLVFVSAAIAVSVWKPYVSLGLVAALLVGQLFHVVPGMESNHWAIYFGSFISLGFIQWTGNRRVRLISGVANAVFILIMMVVMLSWRYGAGVGWFGYPYKGDAVMFRMYGWQLLTPFLLIAVACAAAGLVLSLYEEKRGLFQDRNLARVTLQQTEVDLIIEQERTRISRDLHDVLAHSLAVIAAQADGARYVGEGQPKPVLNALENIARSARSALVDAQRVIEGVDDGGLSAPAPRLSDVKPLLERMQQGSLKIAHSESGDPVGLTTGAQVAVFRIVQECLTNALKHGGRGTAVRVHFDWSGPGLTLHISSDVPATVAGEPTEPQETRPGRGIAGMRERAHLAGGWLTAGPDGEQFRVTVLIPYEIHKDQLHDVAQFVEISTVQGSAGTGTAGHAMQALAPVPQGDGNRG